MPQPHVSLREVVVVAIVIIDKEAEFETTVIAADAFVGRGVNANVNRSVDLLAGLLADDLLELVILPFSQGHLTAIVVSPYVSG